MIKFWVKAFSVRHSGLAFLRADFRYQIPAPVNAEPQSPHVMMISQCIHCGIFPFHSYRVEFAPLYSISAEQPPDEVVIFESLKFRKT